MSNPQIALDFPEVKNLSLLIADRLTEIIQTGDLKPGQHLVQTELAEQFGVSRVAMRDAFYELKQRGLAVNVPRKGTVVRSVSCKTIRDLFAVRRAIEGLAVREACRKMPGEVLDRLDQIIREQENLAEQANLAQLVEKDWEFHRTIYDQCDNEPLKEIITGLWFRTRQARSLAQIDVKWGQEWGKKSAARHRRILEALRQGDPDQTEHFLTEAITLAEEELVQGLQETGWGGEDA